MGSAQLNEKMLSELQTERVQEEVYDSSFKVPGSFGVRINRGGKKSFFLIYAFNGRRKRLSLGIWPLTSLASARARALRLVRMAIKGRDPKKVFGKGRVNDTFAEVADLFLERWAKENCTRSTIKEYQRILAVDLVPSWGELRIDDIEKRQVALLLDGISRGRNSPVMAQRTRALISKLYNFAIAEGLADKNPTKGIAVKALLELPEPQRILNESEIKAFWRALEAEDLLIQTAFKFLLLTGQRVSDVLAMRWSELQLDRWQRGAESDFVVYLSPNAVELLRVLRNEVSSKGEYVFKGRAAAHLVYIRKAAKRIAKRMKAESSWSARDLRQTVRANLFRLGNPAEVVARCLNNKSEWGRAPVVPEDKLQNAMNAWAREVIKIVGASGDGKVRSIFE